jgi:hypothetical protein
MNWQKHGGSLLLATNSALGDSSSCTRTLRTLLIICILGTISMVTTHVQLAVTKSLKGPLVVVTKAIEVGAVRPRLFVEFEPEILNLLTLGMLQPASSTLKGNFRTERVGCTSRTGFLDCVESLDKLLTPRVHCTLEMLVQLGLAPFLLLCLFSGTWIQYTTLASKT